MRIAIIAAMEEEISILKNKMTEYRIEQILGMDFHVGQIADCDTVLLQSGIGKVAATLGTTLLLNHFEIDGIINTGSAGGLSKDLSVGDIVVSTDVFYHDADLTAFGYKPGQMAGCPITFEADLNYQTLAQKCIKRHELHAVLGAIGSGDTFINSLLMIKKIKQTFPHIIAVDMEAAAIGHVCWLFNKPFVVVRAISDNGDDESALDFSEFLRIAAKNSSLVVESMLSELV